MSKIWLPQFGVFGCECVAKSLPLLQTVMLIRGDIRESLDLYQGCYHTGVSASAGTHNKGGCVDTGQYADRHLKTARAFGWCAQHRTPAQGFDPHCHMFPNGCPHMSPLAQSQQWAWNHGRNGLVSNGPITGPGPTGTDTPNWKTGVKRMENEIMAFADDVAAKAAAKVIAGLDGRLDKLQADIDQLQAQTKPTVIADTVLTRDGKIPNKWGDPKLNAHVAAATAFAAIGNQLNAITKKLGA